MEKGKRLHYLQHVWFEDLGIIKTWAEEQGYTVTRTAFFNNEPLPNIAEIDWLVVMGGPMNIHEEAKYPWMKDEKAFIEEAIAQKKKVLGVCLGAQLIADSLGGKVMRNEFKEIGWFPITVTQKTDSRIVACFPERCIVFHWHGDMFIVPNTADMIARSQACPHQGFACDNGRVVGLQFHLELTDEGIDRIVQECADELVDGVFIQKKDGIAAGKSFLSQMNEVMIRILNEMQAVS